MSRVSALSVPGATRRVVLDKSMGRIGVTLTTPHTGEGVLVSALEEGSVALECASKAPQTHTGRSLLTPTARVLPPVLTAANYGSAGLLVGDTILSINGVLAESHELAVSLIDAECAPRFPATDARVHARGEP